MLLTSSKSHNASKKTQIPTIYQKRKAILTKSQGLALAELIILKHVDKC